MQKRKNNSVSRINGRENDANLRRAEEFRSSVVEAGERKTGVHLVNVSAKSHQRDGLKGGDQVEVC